MEASPELPDELAVAAENITDPGHVVYFVASVVPLEGRTEGAPRWTRSRQTFSD